MCSNPNINSDHVLFWTRHFIFTPEFRNNIVCCQIYWVSVPCVLKIVVNLLKIVGYVTQRHSLCLRLFSDPYIAPPESSIYAAVIGISAGVFGFAVIVIFILALLWWIKSKKRSKQRFERASSIRSSVRGSVRSKSTMSMLTDGHSKRRLDSFSSSKFGYDDR